MDWKSTAVISGAGILATWFFSMPPTRPTVASASAPQARAARSAAPRIDIEHEASRLQARIRQQPRYIEPSRNPFRFGIRPAPRPAAAAGAGLAQPVQLAPPPPRIVLDGIAVDSRDGQEQRTAILNTDAGIVLAHEGEEISGYRVDKVGPDLVQLVKLSDGSVLSIGLR